LQKLADKQGHPGAAAQVLRDFGHDVPPEIEAAADGVTPEAVRKAIDQGGPLTTRLQTARGKRLSSDQSRRIGEAEREHARQLEPLRQIFAQDVGRTTGLPEAKVGKILTRDNGTPAAEKKAIADLEKSLGHRLTAGDVNRFVAAREQFRAASQLQRSAFARQVGKIAEVPQSVVLDLMR
jgi:hypothetical protein